MLNNRSGRAPVRRESGNILLTAIFVSAIVGVGVVSAYNRFNDTKDSFRISRMHNLMGAVESQVRGRALQPEAYTGCTSGAATCRVNTAFFDDLVHQSVVGAVCPRAMPKCGIILKLLPFVASSGTFLAEVRYEGLEVKPKPISIAVQVPTEILQVDIFSCGAMNPDLPAFASFDSTGAPVCKGFNTCGTGEFVAGVNATSHTVRCKRLPSQVSCPSQQLISNLNWGGDSLTVSCAGLPDPPYTATPTLPTPGGCTSQQFIAAKASMTSDSPVDKYTLATACIDSVNPNRDDSLPADASHTLRFMNTCGNRWCMQQGFYAGRAIEYYDPNATVECRHKSPPASLGISPACATLLAAFPPVNNIPTTVTDVANGCIDAACPTLASNLPSTVDATTRFVNTCGNRYCRARGYASGVTIEFYGDSATVQCFDAVADAQGNSAPTPVITINSTRDTVANNCIDSVNPTLADNEPTVNLERYMNTCGNRYCVAQGHTLGKVVEIAPDGTVTLECY